MPCRFCSSTGLNSLSISAACATVSSGSQLIANLGNMPTSRDADDVAALVPDDVTAAGMELVVDDCVEVGTGGTHAVTVRLRARTESL